MTRHDLIYVLFVHGLFSNGKIWKDFTHAIKADPDLANRVVPLSFQYSSPIFKLRFTREIPTFSTIAANLASYLRSNIPDGHKVFLVTHSQGGIVAQTFIAQALRQNNTHDLDRIAHLLMYACPNAGSSIALGLRRLLLPRHPHEWLHRRMQADVSGIATLEDKCPFPITACGGETDGVAPNAGATYPFSNRETVSGDHRSIVRPRGPDDQSYLLFKRLVRKLWSVPSGPGLLSAPPGTTLSPPPLSESGSPRSLVPPWGQREACDLEGRDDEVEAVLAEDDRVCVLAGLKGVGKTRVALEVAHRTRGRRDVWWINVNDLDARMQQLALLLNVPKSSLGNRNVPDALWRALDARDRPWLLIFDNADNAEVLAAGEGRVADGRGWLRTPEGANGKVLVTSHDRSTDTWGRWCRVRTIDTLPEDDGIAMLTKIVGNQAAGTREEARLLSRALGGLPLALWCAARHIKSGYEYATDDRLTFRRYRQNLESRLTALPGSGPLDPRMGLELVQEVFKMSLAALADAGMPQAEPLLKAFACMSPSMIPYPVGSHGRLAHADLFDGHPRPDLDKILTRLSDVGLITLDRVSSRRNGSEKIIARTLTMHPAVHFVLRDDDDVTARGRAYYGFTLRLLEEVLGRSDPDQSEDRALWRLVAPHVVHLAKTTVNTLVGEQDLIRKALALARATSRYFIAAGLLTPAGDFLPDLIGECESYGFSSDDREIMDLRHEHGRMMIEVGPPEAAEAEIRHLIADRERVLGRNHRDTWASRHKLAKAILMQDGRWQEAERLLWGILDAEHALDPQHTDSMAVKHTLARAILAQGEGRAATAERICRDILQQWDPDETSTLNEVLFVRGTLVRAMHARGAYQEACEEAERTLARNAEQRDEVHAMGLTFAYSAVLLAKGEVRRAEAEATELLARRVKLLGDQHPDTKRTRDFRDSIRRLLEGGQSGDLGPSDSTD